MQEGVVVAKADGERAGYLSAGIDGAPGAADAARRPHRGPDRAVGVESIARDLAELVDPLGLVETRDHGHLMGQLLGLRSGGRQQQRHEHEFFDGHGKPAFDKSA